ncbi:helix-turn-helix transcriptional regulator [Micromonospora chokoriensis]
MEGDAAPTADMIRAQLRRLRTTAGMSQEDFGRLVHYSGSMVSALELGQRPLDRLFLARADEVLTTGGLLVYLLKLAERDGQPSWFRPWLDAERSARQLRCFQPTLIPGLLQTENYARAVIRCDDLLSDDEVERRVHARLDRQSIMTQPDPPQLIAVVNEHALRQTAEHMRGLMTEQLTQLINYAQRPQVSVHVVPAEVGLHVGMSGPFTLARSADGGWVGNLENQLAGVVVDGDGDVATLLSRWETVRNEAISRRHSIDLMKEAVNSCT